MSTAGFVVHAGRPAAIDAARDLVAWLGERGVRTRRLRGEPFHADDEASPVSFAEGLDVVISVGGDGTLLRAAQLAGPADVPLLGVKVGRLGFLTEVEPAQAPEVLTAMLEGRAVTEERTALIAQREDEPWPAPAWALNEVIVEKRARHRVITLRAMIGDDYVTTFSGDGVIVATPTGSTAYSFSARGPIISPRLEVLVLTPVSPHMVFDRSIVLGPEKAVTIEVVGEEPGELSADGQEGTELPLGARVRIERSATPARLVRREGSPPFFELLREKFSLPGDAPTAKVGPVESSGITMRRDGRPGR